MFFALPDVGILTHMELYRSTDLPLYELNVFSSIEAEEITGVRTILQRDWRRRKLVPTIIGYSKYTIADLALFKILKALTDTSVPQITRDALAPICTQVIVKNALACADDLGMARVYEGFAPAWFDKGAMAETIVGDLSRSAAFGAIPVDQEPLHQFVITSGSSPRIIWPKSIPDQDAIRHALEDGAGIVVNMAELARGLVKKTPRPFVKLICSEVANA